MSTTLLLKRLRNRRLHKTGGQDKRNTSLQPDADVLACAALGFDGLSLLRSLSSLYGQYPVPNGRQNLFGDSSLF